MDKLQIGIIIGAVVLALVAALILTGALPGLRLDEGEGIPIEMWGFDDPTALEDVFSKYSREKSGARVEYQKKSMADFETDLLNALARGASPDVVVFPSDLLSKHGDKLSSMPPVLFTERELRLTYPESAAEFLKNGVEILGMPFYARALILYYNADVFTKNFITLPPKNWDEFLDTASKTTQKDPAGNIIIAGAALGRAQNIANAHTVLETLFLQSGDKIIKKEIGRQPEIVLGDSIRAEEIELRPAESSLRFVSDFSNPKKSSQSWSAAMPEAKEAFVAGKLGMYLGFTDEFSEIKSKNPHLAFAISAFPQLRGAARPITGGTLFALAVPKASTRQRQAWEFIKFISNKENAASLADRRKDVSLRRDTLPDYQKESVRSVFAESMLALKLWPNPDPGSTEAIFKTLIEDAAQGRDTLRGALGRAKARLAEIR